MFEDGWHKWKGYHKDTETTHDNTEMFSFRYGTHMEAIHIAWLYPWAYRDSAMGSFANSCGGIELRDQVTSCQMCQMCQKSLKSLSLSKSPGAARAEGVGGGFVQSHPQEWHHRCPSAGAATWPWIKGNSRRIGRRISRFCSPKCKARCSDGTDLWLGIRWKGKLTLGLGVWH